MEQISGKNVSLDLEPSGLSVIFENVSLKINDGSKATTSNGRPDGWVDGETTADGEVELDSANFKIFNQAVKDAGSYRAFPPQDLVFYANVGGVEKKIEAFECKFKIADLLNAKASGGEKLTTKLPFEVTGKDFVNIDGVPYLEAL